MNTKRLILMMLVMLMSVTGAWAQNNVIRYTATSKIADSYWQGVSGSATSIATHTFDPASKLGVVTYNNDITVIGYGAFEGLPLISIDLPSGVSSIGDYAFFYCSSLTAIDLPASITSFGFLSFGGCSSLKKVTINSQQTLNAIGYLTDDLGQHGQGAVDLTFGDQVEEYILNGNITIIPEYKFEFSSITSITLPETLTKIEGGAFRFGSLTSITIPASVTSIGLYSFRDCPLQSIIVNATTPPTLNSSFLGVSTSIPVYVPEGTVDTYKAANYWKDFTNFIEMIPWLNLASSDSSLGKVYGAGRYNTTTEVTIYAIPEAGSKFIGWSDGSTENPRQYVVMEDASLTANFEAENVFQDPTEPGMRMKVTMKDGKVFERNTRDIESVEYHEVTE